MNHARKCVECLSKHSTLRFARARKMEMQKVNFFHSSRAPAVAMELRMPEDDTTINALIERTKNSLSEEQFKSDVRLGRSECGVEVGS